MFISLKSKIALFALLGSTLFAQGQSFVLTSDNFLPLYDGPIKWADLDNDNDLDIIYCGFTDAASEYHVRVYENINGAFSLRSTAIPDVRNGSFALGDYDNDGDLDILLSGLSGSNNISVLYNNNGAFSFTLKQSFPGLFNVVGSWFDIDNDNDLDFLLAGIDNNSGLPIPSIAKMMVYENSGGNFSLINGTNLPPCEACSMDWADSNGDGKTDLIISGFHENEVARTELYINNGNKTFTKDQGSPLPDLYGSDVKWGDYDNDGDMDLLLTGIATDDHLITSVYRNDGGIFHENTLIQIRPTVENSYSGTGWVDYNNDGFLDILVTGRGTSLIVVDLVFKLYKNNGNGTFSEVNVPTFFGLAGSVDFGDFDNDGDVDFCFSGVNLLGVSTGIYKNKLIDGAFAANTKPSPPSAGFTERFFRKQVKLLSKEGTDMQTAIAGLSYNFYLKKGASKIALPTADLNTGYLLTTNPSNGHGRIIQVNDIGEGDFSWAVQAIDGGKSGSLFSAEKTFYQINGPSAIKTEIVDATSVKLSWLDNSSIETSYALSRSVSATSGFSSLVNLPVNTTSYIDNYAFLTDTYYYYRVNASNATKASAYDSLSVLIPTAPANLLAQSINASKISIAWQDLSQYESGYEVQRKLSTLATFQTIAVIASNTTSYLDTLLTEGTSYDYRVRAAVSNGSSTFSNIASEKTNFKPSGANFGKKTLEDVSLNFAAKDFTDVFSDLNVSDQLVKISIKSLPEKGKLKLNTASIVSGQIILLTDLRNIVFIPDPNANGSSSFDFYVNDGKDNSTTSYTVNLTITPVNDVPAFSIPATLKVDEDFVSKVKIVPTPATVPSDELSQVVTYSVLPVTSDKVNVQLNSSTGEIDLTSVLNQNGEVQFILTANDGQTENNTFVDTLKLVINPVNDPPVLSKISDFQVQNLLALPTIPFTVTDVDSPISTVSVSASSNNQAVIKNQNITIQGATEERSIVLIPENVVGDATIKLSATDGSANSTTQFKFTISAITGISEPTNNTVEVYPNPFSSVINIRTNLLAGNTYEAVLYDQLGREIRRREISDRESIITSTDLCNGIYILSISGDNGNILFRKKVVKN